MLVIVLAIGLTWFAQRVNHRTDTTLGGSLSLKPQSLAVLKQVKQHITLVSLYTKPEKSDDKDDQVKITEAQRVSDLLDEYKGNNGNIDVKVIDPAKEKDKLEDLHQDFVKRYGGAIKGYSAYLEDWQKQYDQIKKLADAESAAVAPMVKPEENSVSDLINTISDEVPDLLSSARKNIDHELKQKHPDYKAAADYAKKMMQQVSQLAGAISSHAGEWMANPAGPARFQTISRQSRPAL